MVAGWTVEWMLAFWWVASRFWFCKLCKARPQKKQLCEHVMLCVLTLYIRYSIDPIYVVFFPQISTMWVYVSSRLTNCALHTHANDMYSYRCNEIFTPCSKMLLGRKCYIIGSITYQKEMFVTLGSHLFSAHWNAAKA